MRLGRMHWRRLERNQLHNMRTRAPLKTGKYRDADEWGVIVSLAITFGMVLGATLAMFLWIPIGK
jgi:hypothetical protein